MPAKVQITRETCRPCKHLFTELLMSGRNPLYGASCMHPESAITTAGRVIGSASDPDRPDWCPLRGDPEAEKEATGRLRDDTTDPYTRAQTLFTAEELREILESLNKHFSEDNHD